MGRAVLAVSGKDGKFPMNSTVVINRLKMAFSVSGITFPQNPKPAIKHLIDRLHDPEAVRFWTSPSQGPRESFPVSGAKTWRCRRKAA